MKTSTNECLGRIEQIAALAENNLPADERIELLEHVSDCEVCYELLTELIRLQDEERGSEAGAESSKVVSLSHRRRSLNSAISRRHLIWAAAALLVVTATSFLIFSQDSIPRSEVLTAELEKPVGDWSQPSWSGPRGEGDADRAISLRIGVRVVDLDLALRFDEVMLGRELAADLERLLEETALVDLADHYTRLQSDTMSPSELLSAARYAEAELDVLLGEVLDGNEYRLGKRLEAARLASRARSSKFFEGAEYDALIRELGRNTPPLREIANTGRFSELESTLTDILRSRAQSSEL